MTKQFLTWSFGYEFPPAEVVAASLTKLMTAIGSKKNARISVCDWRCTAYTCIKMIQIMSMSMIWWLLYNTSLLYVCAIVLARKGACLVVCSTSCFCALFCTHWWPLWFLDRSWNSLAEINILHYGKANMATQRTTRAKYQVCGDNLTKLNTICHSYATD